MDITPPQRIQLEKIGRRRHLRFLILHGSYATNTPRAGSDLDLAYVVSGPERGDEYLQLFGELAKVFGNGPHRELDVKSLHGVDPLFRYQVVRDGVLLYGNPADYEEFRLYAYRDYNDSYDLRRLQDRLLKNSMAEISRRYD